MNDQVKETSELETKEVNPQIFKVTVHNVEDTDSTGACPVVQKKNGQKNQKGCQITPFGRRSQLCNPVYKHRR